MGYYIKWKEVKTRKPHRCFGCMKTYPKGTMMVSATNVDGGDINSCYWCNVCQEYMRRFFELGDETGEGEIFENDPENWEKIALELNS